jgi:dephospho-CoA kinase
MYVIGLLGGVASGKSLVAEAFEQRLPAVVLDADRAAHEVLRQPEVVAEVRRRWGDDVVDQDGEIDRKSLAAIVFAPPPDGPRELAQLERIVHPRVRAAFQERIDFLTDDASYSAVVIDAPLLLEAGWGPLCDATVFVDADRSVRLARARTRGWTDEEFSAREAAQIPVEEKRSKADFVIDNSGPPMETYAQILGIWRSISKSLER